MRLTALNLVHYLLERGLVSAASVVDGDWLVSEASSRHRNFKVLRREHPGLFVKQADPHDPQALATLGREATCYWLAAHDARFTGLRAVMPAHHLYDPASGVLVLELLPGSENLSEYHRRLGHFPPEVGRQLGAALGHYHQSVRVPEEGADATQPFPRAVPWVLNSPQLSASMVGAPSGGSAKAMEIVRQYPDFQRTLNALAADWRRDSLIHGDMKWENCLVAGEGEAQTVRVVDWELADFGDACWDVGAIFQSYLTCWITSLPLDGTRSPGAVMHLAQFPIERMQAAIAAYWQTYAAARGLRGRAADEALERSVRYAAARMIQTAYEYLHVSPQVSPHTLCLLQLSLNVLTDPGSAIRDLLELEAAA